MATRNPRLMAPGKHMVRDPSTGRLVAEVDLLVERDDLGPGCATLVAAGDPIPAELVDLPRKPR